MAKDNNELVAIVTQFAESGWDLIDAPAKAWLNAKDAAATSDLIAAIKKADVECGNCGCEFDPLYKKTLGLLAA